MDWYLWNRRIKRACILLIKGLLFGGPPVALATGFGVAIWRISPAFDQVMSLLTILLSWPPVIGAIIVFFLIFFRNPLMFWVRNFVYRNPQGHEFFARDQDPSQITISTSYWHQVQDYFAQLEEYNKQITGERQELLKHLEQVEIKALLWEFQYLNLFLVPTSKSILKWIDMLSPSIDLFNQFWALISEKQREIIIGVLYANELITWQNKILTTTTKGKLFIGFYEHTEHPKENP